jgi:phosphomannomutase
LWIDLGLSTTPTVEIAVPLEKAEELFLLPPNPKQWNALKLLNDKEFLNGIEGEKYLLSLKPKRLISQMWIV